MPATVTAARRCCHALAERVGSVWFRLGKERSTTAAERGYFYEDARTFVPPGEKIVTY